MTAPYRDNALLVETEISDEPEPLASFDVSGRHGADGTHGVPGRDAVTTGGNGGPGGDASAAAPGEGAGEIRIALSAADASVRIEGEVVARGERRDVRDLVLIDENGFISLRAIGGDGGKGGNGGRGGDGADGSNGSDATRWSSGGDGGDGGDGGPGGDATSGADGGPGGRVEVTVSEDDTPLLMLLRHDVHGGDGGAPGTNGSGGSGGSGGRGGDSYSWSETEHYTDGSGNRQSRTHYHRNSGGSNGSSGSSGASGNARVKKGAKGAAGTFTIRVGDATYESRYDLRLASFAHDSANEDAVYEPNELVRVFGLEVENVGGMPTPKRDVLALALEPGGWVKPEPGQLECKPGLEPGARYQVPGELKFRIKDFVPAEPGDPLEVDETILQRAMLPSVRRAFEEYQQPEDELGKFVIRFPLRCSPVQSLKSLAAGEATRVRFSITNQSRFALGAASTTKRVIRVRVATAPDSELGDEHVAFLAGGETLAPGAGWTTEITDLGAGDTTELELVVRIADNAAEYLRFAAHVTLELGELEAPARTRPIQLRDFDIRVARPFAVSDADVLLVVNHKTSREVIEAWQSLADDLACNVAVWDLTREGHLDLEKPLADGIALGAWFANKAIILLDNAIDGPDGTTYPHVYLDDAQAARAAIAGLDIAIVGKGMPLERVLVREETPTTTPVHRSYWVRWWAKPRQDWLVEQAQKLAARLAEEHPEQRNIVVHRFAPQIEGKSMWMNRWRVGTLDVIRTLDAAAASLVHADATEPELADPAFVRGDHVQTAMLVMFGFEENLERLRRLVERGDDAQRVVDALVLDLANELCAAIAPGWMGEASSTDLPLPRLDALERLAFSVDHDSDAGATLRAFAARLLFIANSQVGWWENIPPFVWMRRRPTTRRRIANQLRRWIAATFPDDAKRALEAVDHATDALVKDHKQQRKQSFVAKRRAWSLEQALLPIAPTTLTTDTELLATAESRVMSGEHYDETCAAKIADRIAREKLLANAEQQHATLFVR